MFSVSSTLIAQRGRSRRARDLVRRDARPAARGRRGCGGSASSTCGYSAAARAGSVSEAAADYGRRRGIAVIDGGCPCMFDPTADLGHKAMRVVFTLTGNVPKEVWPEEVRKG
jgi:hypothetical protein